jgi:hypothetical protein
MFRSELPIGRGPGPDILAAGQNFTSQRSLEHDRRQSLGVPWALLDSIGLGVQITRAEGATREIFPVCARPHAIISGLARQRRGAGVISRGAREGGPLGIWTRLDAASPKHGAWTRRTRPSPGQRDADARVLRPGCRRGAHSGARCGRGVGSLDALRTRCRGYGARFERETVGRRAGGEKRSRRVREGGFSGPALRLRSAVAFWRQAA